MPFTADFETITTEPTRVWLWAICDIDNNSYKNVITGTNIKTFFDEIEKSKYNKQKIYFHNLKFDGYFILWYIMKELNYPYSKNNKQKNSYEVLIANTGQWYEIKIRFSKTTVTILDSLKKIPFSVRDIAQAFKLPMTKGEIEYNLPRDLNYQPTEKEIDYIRRDVQIPAQALKKQFEQGLNKMTIGADALNSYKKSNKKFRDIFPLLSPECDNFCRKAYKGGVVQIKSGMENKLINEKGCVYDVNSMYPAVMRYNLMPYGQPIYFEGEFIKDNNYPLAIIKINADFKIKKNHLPTIQIKGCLFGHLEREYITDSNGIIELTLSSVDFELFKEQYDIYELQFIGGFKFKGCNGMFNEYIDHWSNIKAHSKGALRTIAKLMLNNLYGKFAKNPDTTGKIPYIDEHNAIRLKLGSPEISDTVYVPIGVFITSWARDKLIRSAQACYDRFLYCDTDSIHLLGTTEPNIEIHNTKLGAWKLENTFTKAKFIKPKCYIEKIVKKYKIINKRTGKIKQRPKITKVRDYNIKVTVSGLPSNCKKFVTFDNFKIGQVYNGKLTQKSVEGGAILKETTFMIGV